MRAFAGWVGVFFMHLRPELGGGLCLEVCVGEAQYEQASLL